MFELLATHGRVVVASNNAMPQDQRLRVLARLTDYEHLARGKLIRALEKVRTQILQETPSRRALP
jgi:hypothetical protein